MDKKKILGIILIISAVVIAGAAIWNYLREDSQTEQEETTTVISEINTDIETNGNTEEHTQKIEDHMQHEAIEKVEVKYPKEEVLELVDNDKEGLQEIIQEFSVAFGVNNIMYAEYADEVEMDTKRGKVKLTFYIKRRRQNGIYFYVEYDNKTKDWIYILA